MQYKDYIKMRNFTVTTEDGEYKPKQYKLFSKPGILRVLRNASNTTNSGVGLIKLTTLNYLTYYGTLASASVVTGIPLVVIPCTPLMLAGINPVSTLRSLYSKYDNKIGEIIYKVKDKFKDKKLRYTESSEGYADKFKLDPNKNYIVSARNNNLYVYGNPEGYSSDLELFTQINRLVNSGITEFKVITGKQVKKLIPKQYLME